jgi:hypothetical protein
MSDKIICKINDEPTIIVKFGEQGLKGDGTTVHSELTNLGYNNAGHIGFQKALTYIPEYKSYEIE